MQVFELIGVSYFEYRIIKWNGFYGITVDEEIELSLRWTSTPWETRGRSSNSNDWIIWYVDICCWYAVHISSCHVISSSFSFHRLSWTCSETNKISNIVSYLCFYSYVCIVFISKHCLINIEYSKFLMFMPNMDVSFQKIIKHFQFTTKAVYEIIVYGLVFTYKSALTTLEGYTLESDVELISH